MYPIQMIQATNKAMAREPKPYSSAQPPTPTCRRCSQDISLPPLPASTSPSPSTPRHSSRSSAASTRRRRHPPQTPPVPTGKDVKAELSNMIDEHIAWTQGKPAPSARRGSQGTMIVDWDGTGAPVVSWREREVGFSSSSSSSFTPTAPSPSPSYYNDAVISQARNPVAYYQPQRPCSPLIPPSSSPPPQQQQQQQPRPLFTAFYHPPCYSPTTQTHHAAYVDGYDASASLSYDYDGRVVHVHRRGQGQQKQHDKSSARLSAHSDYFSMDVEKYGRGVEVRMAGDEDKGDDEVGNRKKSRRSVGRFVEKVLYKLEGMGILGRLREDRKKVIGGKMSHV